MSGETVLHSSTATAGRNLAPLFAPESVAIVGGSDDPAKFGYTLARGALRGEHRRPVYFVSQRAATIAGRRTYRSFADLDGAPDLVVLAAPASAVSAVVEDALAVGARAFLGITSGIPPEVEKAVASRIREAGAVLLGPNCIGFADGQYEIDLFAWGRFDVGPVAVLSGSGSLAMDIGRGVSDAGLGVSRIVSMGNCADLGPADLIRDLAHHDSTRVIAVYCENMGDGRDLLRASAEARESGKPVVALVAEPTDATARAAMTHTRALLSDGRVVQAAFQAAGIVQVHSIGDLLRAVRVLAVERRPRGRRIGVVSEGGGPGVMAADAMARAGLEVPEFSPGLQQRLGHVVHEMGSALNPVDIGFGGTVSVVCAAAETMAESGEVDVVAITGLLSASDLFIRESARPEDAARRTLGALPEGETFTLSLDMARRDHEAARGFVRAAARTGVAAYGAFADPASMTAGILDSGGCPVFRSIDEVAKAVALSVVGAGEQAKVPDLPVRGAGLAAEDYFTTRQFLRDAGMPFARATAVSSLDEARRAARDIGYPVVLKALVALHKSDSGGVALGLTSDAELEEAFNGMTHLRATTYSVEEMVSSQNSLELILGARTDKQFGPIVLVGMGGIYSELLDDTAVALAPIDPDEAEGLIRRLRGAAILSGHRGQPPVAIRAAAEALSALSQAIASAPDVAEIEVNPLLVLGDRAVGLDARAVL